MTLNLNDKKAIVVEVNQVAAKAVAVVAAENQGLTVEQMTRLRAEARKADVYLRVVRNTLARRALENTAFACLQEALVGPLMLAFSMNEPSAAARLMRNFAKEYEKLAVKSLVFEGKLLGLKDLEKLADLPTRDEALSLLMAVLQAPATKLVRTLNEAPAKLARTFAALRDQKQAA